MDFVRKQECAQKVPTAKSAKSVERSKFCKNTHNDVRKIDREGESCWYLQFHHQINSAPVVIDIDQLNNILVLQSYFVCVCVSSSSSHKFVSLSSSSSLVG